MDNTLVAHTPEGIGYVIRPAGVVPRALAFALDSVFSLVVTGVLVLLLSLTSFADATWVTLLITFTVIWFYHSGFEIVTGGYTPGKRIVGLRVVMADGAPVEPGAAITRNLLRVADQFFGLTLIGLVSIVASDGFRRLGDWAAGTLVVYTGYERSRIVVGSEPWLAGRSPVAPSRLLSRGERTSILEFCRRYPQLGPARASEIARHLVPTLTAEPEAVRFAADYLLCVGVALIGEHEPKEAQQ